jgi:hypothetical protein
LADDASDDGSPTTVIRQLEALNVAQSPDDMTARHRIAAAA